MARFGADMGLLEWKEDSLGAERLAASDDLTVGTDVLVKIAADANRTVPRDVEQQLSKTDGAFRFSGTVTTARHTPPAHSKRVVILRVENGADHISVTRDHEVTYHPDGAQQGHYIGEITEVH